MMRLNVWYIQEVEPLKGCKRSFQPIRFIRRNGRPELGRIYPTIEEARAACGSPDAELL